MFDDIEVGLFEVAWCWKLQHLKTTSIFVSAGRKLHVSFSQNRSSSKMLPLQKDGTLVWQDILSLDCDDFLRFNSRCWFFFGRIFKRCFFGGIRVAAFFHHVADITERLEGTETSMSFSSPVTAPRLSRPMPAWPSRWLKMWLNWLRTSCNKKQGKEQKNHPLPHENVRKISHTSNQQFFRGYLSLRGEGGGGYEKNGEKHTTWKWRLLHLKRGHL